MNGFETVAYMLFVLLLAMIFHEGTHWIALRQYYKDARVYFTLKPLKLWTGTEQQFRKLKSEERARIYLAGVLSGLIPIFIASLGNNQVYWLLFPYAMMCKKDFVLFQEEMKDD